MFESSSVMEKRDVSAILSKQQDTLTEVLKPTTSSVQTEDKIYFNDKSSTPSPKSVEKINKKVFVTGKTGLRMVFCFKVF